MNGQAESSVDSVDREAELEPAEEVTENGPTGGSAPREGTFYTHFLLFVLRNLRMDPPLFIFSPLLDI